jgi:hypothetical protein
VGHEALPFNDDDLARGRAITGRGTAEYLKERLDLGALMRAIIDREPSADTDRQAYVVQMFAEGIRVSETSLMQAMVMHHYMTDDRRQDIKAWAAKGFHMNVTLFLRAATRSKEIKDGDTRWMVLSGLINKAVADTAKIKRQTGRSTVPVVTEDNYLDALGRIRKLPTDSDQVATQLTVFDDTETITRAAYDVQSSDDPYATWVKIGQVAGFAPPGPMAAPEEETTGIFLEGLSDQSTDEEIIRNMEAWHDWIDGAQSVIDGPRGEAMDPAYRDRAKTILNQMMKRIVQGH